MFEKAYALCTYVFVWQTDLYGPGDLHDNIKLCCRQIKSIDTDQKFIVTPQEVFYNKSPLLCELFTRYTKKTPGK